MSDGARRPADAPAFLAGGGEMGALMRAHDWSVTPVGPAEAWPQPLRTAIRLLLNTGHPMYVWWGPELLCFYNDAYRASIGPERHPGSLGRRGREVWDEIWPIIGPQVEQVMAGGGAARQENALIPITRNGRREDVYWTYSYGPIDDEAAATGVGGVLVVCTETTEQVLTAEGARADRERLSRMFEQAPGFITILKGPEHVFEFTNGTYRRLFGDRDFVGRTVREAFPDLEGQGFFDLLDRVHGTGERFVARGVPIHLRRSPGEAPEERVLDFIYEPILNEAGQVTGNFCEGHDVTEARRAEVALRRSEERLRFLDRLGAETAALAEADAVLATTTRLVGEHMGVSLCAYADMDENEDGFTLRGDWAPPGARSIVGRYSLADFGTRAVTTLRAGLPLVVDDTLRELAPEAAATFQAIGIAATICMPLVKAGRLTALMAVHDRVPRAWAADELTLLREITARSWAHVERVGATAELRRSEELLRLATDAADVGLWDLDARTEELFWQPRVKALFGIAADAPVSMRDFHEGVHPEDRQRTIEAFAAARDPARRAHYDVEYRTIGQDDGRVRWVAAKGRGVFDDEGRCLRILGTTLDITARKAAEDRLRELNETLGSRVAERTAERNFLARIVETTDAFIQVLDLDSRFLAINKASADEFERIYGVRPQVGDAYPELLADRPEELAAVLALWGRALAGEEFTVTEAFGDPALDRPFYEIKFNTLRNDGGERIGAYQFAHDVTERLRAEERLRQTEAALRQSQKMEAVGQLTGGLAHDFNNLLAGISGSLEVMATRIAQGRIEDVERYLVAAQGAARRAAALTHRLLAFSRRQTLAPKVTDLNALVAGMEELIRRTVGPGVAVESVTAEGVWPVEVDPNQLENALLNLAINARDAMPDGGTLTIATANHRLDARAARAQELAPGSYVRLSVTDTGTGMTEEVRARAFDPFFTTKPLGLGTGLGLSMVYGFARQSGGQVRIHSEVGQGTTVGLSLPRHFGAGHEPEPPGEGAATAPAGTGGTVLVIDDEALVRMLVVDVLEELGYSTLEAADGPEGLRRLQSRARVDLLITDVGLPGGLNGRQVADAARVLRPGLKVLFITGYAETAVLSHGDLEPGMHIVTKPFAVEDLGRRIGAILAAP